MAEMFDYLATLPLVDHHCHPIVGESRKGDVEAFIRATSEAPSWYPLADLKQRLVWEAVQKIITRYTKAKWTTDEQLAAVLMNLDYKSYCCSLFKDSGYQTLFVDTGYSPDSAPPLSELARLTGTAAYPILRLEKLAESWLVKEKTFTQWWERISAQIKEARQKGYIGAKSIAAYRSGLDIHRVDLQTAKQSFEAWKKSGILRLSDRQLVNFLVWNAAPILAEQSLPLQFHTGYGDPDMDLLLGNPLLLRDFIESFTPDGLSVVLLHCYPYHREAGYLASVYNNVYFDTSLIVPLGPSSARRVVAEALELAPYSRYLFASDAHTRPEIFALAAELFRDAFANHLEDSSVVRYTSIQKRESWANCVFHQNAKRLYPGCSGKN